MIKPSQFFKEFEKTMSAVAFAEQGEYDTARQILTAGKDNKKVLLGTDELELDPTTIKYTLKLCRRMEGGLEILHVNPGCNGKTGVHARNNFFRDSLGKIYKKQLMKKGILYMPVWSRKSIVEEITDYVSSRRNIIGVVVKSSSFLTKSPSRRGETSRDLSRLLRKIQCPVISYGPTATSAHRH